MVKYLLPLIPPHITYVEPFGGGAQLLFAKPPSKVEVYNDIDEGLVNFFRVLRDARKAPKLIELLKLTPYSREEYNAYRQTWGEQQDDVEKARQWFVVCRQSFGGIFGGSWGFTVTNARGGPPRWWNCIVGLPEVVDRLKYVQIEHHDFRKIFQIYDTPETLFYIDPPYIRETRRDSQYRSDLTNEDHRDLVSILLQIEGMAIVSGYNHPIYNKLSWERRDYNTVCYSAAKTKASNLKGKGSLLKQQGRMESVWICPRIMEWLNRGRLF